MLLAFAFLSTQIGAKTTRRKRPEIRYREIRLPDELLNLAQSDDPYAQYRHGDRDDHGEDCPADNPSMCGFDPKCESGLTICEAEIKKEDCICDCNQEPPPKCQIDFAILIDVCSCSLDVWKGITSYVKTIVKKLNREIGIGMDKVHIGITQYSSATETIVDLNELDQSTDYESLLKKIDELKMDKFIAQGSYVTHGLDETLRMFQNSKRDANRVLLSTMNNHLEKVTDGYNHPSVTPGEIKKRVKVFNKDNITLHAIGRTHLTSYEDCNHFASASRTEVCQKRAETMHLLNDGDDEIFRYDDPRAAHDVVSVESDRCPAHEKRELHCDCMCPLPQGCPGADGQKGAKGEQGAPGHPGKCGPDGEPGENGAEGKKGEKGEPGPWGAPGMDGPMGQPGIPGLHGIHGDRGAKGQPGPKGDKGALGPRGDSGDHGLEGEPGIPGERGVKGQVGPPGPLGRPQILQHRELKKSVFAMLDELAPKLSAEAPKLSLEELSKFPKR